MTWLYSPISEHTKTHFSTRALTEIETVENNRHKWIRSGLWLGSGVFPRLVIIFVLSTSISHVFLLSVALELVMGPLGAATALANHESAPTAWEIPSATPPSVHPLHLPFLFPVVVLQLDERCKLKLSYWPPCSLNGPKIANLYRKRLSEWHAKQPTTSFCF